MSFPLVPFSDDFNVFAFGETCTEIVKEVAKRKFQVPGMTIRTQRVGMESGPCRMIKQVKGHNFNLMWAWDGRNAILQQVAIKERRIQVFPDNSGPRYWLYVGKDWDTDAEKFLEYGEHLYDPSGHGIERMWLHYIGSDEHEEHYRNGSTPYRNPGTFLVHSSDGGLQPDRLKSEPKSFNTKAICENIDEWLKSFVLAYIKA